jgi:hypothetical protein
MCRSERGQAGVDYLAVLAVVGTVLLAALAGALPAADAVPRAVAAAFERAYCLVSQGDCLDGRPRPCVVRSDERARERRASVVAVRLADGRTVIREDRSDGTVVVTVEEGVRIGGALTAGGQLTVGGKGVKAQAEVVLDGRGSRGRRYVLPDAETADRFVAQGADDDRLVPAERWWTLGKGGEAGGTLQALGLKAEARMLRGTVAGVRDRPRTGERTIVLRSDGELTAVLTAPLAELGAGLPASSVVELTFDAHGRPASLLVRGIRGVHGEAGLGPLSSSGGNLLEVEARLDLTDPAVHDHAAALLAALRSVAPGRAVEAARRLGARLADRARVDLRLYRTDQTSAVKGVTAGILGRLGFEIEELHRTARLVDAAGREPGQGWARRLDCVGIA